jgi:hypothetical protein
MTNHETYYSVDSKLRVLHTQPWPSSSSFYVHHPSTQPLSTTYSTSGDSNSEYKHQTNDANHGHHQDLGGKKKDKEIFTLNLFFIYRLMPIDIRLSFDFLE